MSTHGGPSQAKDADLYRREWAAKTRRSPEDIYIPTALREKIGAAVAEAAEAYQPRHAAVTDLAYEGQLEFDLGLDTGPVEGESPHLNAFETAFVVFKTREGNWGVNTDTSALSADRQASPDEIRQGAQETLEYYRLQRIVEALGHSH